MPVPPRRSHAPRRGDRDRRGEERRGVDQEDVFGDEIGWMPWHAPGLRAGPALRGLCAGQPGDARHRLRRPRAGQLGRHVQGVLPAHHRIDRARRGLARRRNASGRAVRPQAVAPLPEAERAARSSPSCCPLLRGLLSADVAARCCTSPTAPTCWSSSDRRATRSAGRAWAPPARTTSCAPRSAADACRSTPGHDDGGAARRAAGPAGRALPRPTTPPTTSAASAPTSPAMRDPNPVRAAGARHRPAHLRRRTRPRRASPASSTSTRST